MTVELRPLGVTCNIGCLYCYQNKHRDAANVGKSYDLELMKSAIEELGGPFHVFGGEPLLMEKSDLEDLWQWGLAKYGRNGLQTNGTLLTNDHVRMIRKYNVAVGLSIDGPGALNDARWAGSLDRTRQATKRSEQSLQRLATEGLLTGILIQLSRINASPTRLPLLCNWLRSLDAMGVRSARIHVLEIEHTDVRSHLALTTEENIAAFELIAELEDEFTTLRFDLFSEIEQNLQFNDSDSSCVWRACDPYTTEAVNGVGGQGERHNCGLTDKEGIDFQKPAQQGFERNLALYYTPQEYGGCQGCRFFLACKGQCPGTGIDGDWRNRSENCGVWKALYARAEESLAKKGIVPLSLHESRSALEGIMVGGWVAGENLTINQCVTRMSVVPNIHISNNNERRHPDRIASSDCFADIDWYRLAEPQPDEYDTDVTLDFAQRTTNSRRKEFYKRRPTGNSPTICDGQVAVRYIQEQCPYAYPVINGFIDHPNILIAGELLRRWPLVHRQFKRLIDSFHPLWESTIPVEINDPPLLSISGADESMFGTLFASTIQPHALAEAFVHEMAHQKLHALGVSFECTDRLIRNPPEQLFQSPVILDRRRPMTAVLHATYSFTYITQLDVLMLEHEEDEENRYRLVRLLADNLPRIQNGIAEVIASAESDEAGAQFIYGLHDWILRVSEAGTRLLH